MSRNRIAILFFTLLAFPAAAQIPDEVQTVVDTATCTENDGPYTLPYERYESNGLCNLIAYEVAYVTFLPGHYMPFVVGAVDITVPEFEVAVNLDHFIPDGESVVLSVVDNSVSLFRSYATVGEPGPGRATFQKVPSAGRAAYSISVNGNWYPFDPFALSDGALTLPEAPFPQMEQTAVSASFAAIAPMSAAATNQLPTGGSRPSGAIQATTGQTYSYTTVATDPDNDNVYFAVIAYPVSTGVGTQFNTPWYPSGTPVTFSLSFSTTEPWIVKARAFDQSPMGSDVFPGLEVSVSNQANNKSPGVPTPPRVSGPASGGSTAAFYTTAQDPDGDTVHYEFDFSDNSRTTVGPYPSDVEGSTTHWFQNSGVFYVSARAIDQHGVAGPWSTASQVAVTPTNNNPPTRPTAPSWSGNGAVEIGPGNSYTLDTVSTDPDGDAVRFEFDWDDGWRTTRTPDPSASHAWAHEGVYFVRVRAFDQYNAQSQWSKATTVRVDFAYCGALVLEPVTTLARYDFNRTVPNEQFAILNVGSWMKEMPFYYEGCANWDLATQSVFSYAMHGRSNETRGPSELHWGMQMQSENYCKTSSVTMGCLRSSSTAVDAPWFFMTKPPIAGLKLIDGGVAGIGRVTCPDNHAVNIGVDAAKSAASAAATFYLGLYGAIGMPVLLEYADIDSRLCTVNYERTKSHIGKPGTGLEIGRWSSFGKPVVLGGKITFDTIDVSPSLLNMKGVVGVYGGATQTFAADRDSVRHEFAYNGTYAFNIKPCPC